MLPEVGYLGNIPEVVAHGEGCGRGAADGGALQARGCYRACCRVLGLWCGGWCKGERCKVFVCFNNIQEMGV